MTNPETGDTKPMVRIKLGPLASALYTLDQAVEIAGILHKMCDVFITTPPGAIPTTKQ